MPNVKIRGIVVVGDGRKTLLLNYHGTRLQPHLEVRQVIQAPDNPPTSEQGTDRPGRSFQSAGVMRSAVSQTDWHDMAERKFAKQVVGVLQSLHQTEEIKELILVAPPRTLACLRQEIPDSMKKLIVAEIDKDLTKLPLNEIATHLAAK
ncbi:host attachment protein [Microvirga antarctica]|uniref:host attachment protein n=1 Tax=Microvirga antarctica TaxID=2819233 RepID=UPI001FEC279E|nr:host attachment protein [Microvirga antarctica]